MNPEPNHSASEKAVREIKRRTRRKFSTEEKIRIVLEGLRGEMSISELCRREDIHPNLYYNWSKEFLEAGKKRLHYQCGLRGGRAGGLGAELGFKQVL